MDHGLIRTEAGAGIGEALIRLLQKETIDKISVTQICEEAGVNRSTFYNYFDDKYQLVEAVMLAAADVFIEESEEFVQKLKQNRPDLKPEQYLFMDEILTFYLEMMKRYKDVFRTFALNQGQFSSTAQYDLLVEQIVLPMLRKHGIDDPRFADYMSSYYVGAIHAVVLNWVEHGCEDEIPYVVKAIRTCMNVPEEYF